MNDDEIKEKFHEFEEKLKQRENNLFRAVHTFMMDLHEFNSGKLKEFPQGSLIGLLYALLKRRMLIIIGGILASLFTIAQVWLLYNQNLLLKSQNYKIDIQSRLAESARRGDVYLLMGNIYDSMQKELDAQANDKESKTLSENLVGQIISLSHSLRPYSHLKEDGELSESSSVEKGNLFLYLIQLNIEESIKTEIFKRGDFSKMDLQNAVISNVRVNFNGFGNGTLTNVTFSNCTIKGTLYDYKLDNVNFDECNLSLSLVAQGNIELIRNKGELRSIESHFEEIKTLGDSTVLRFQDSRVDKLELFGSSTGILYSDLRIDTLLAQFTHIDGVFPTVAEKRGIDVRHYDLRASTFLGDINSVEKVFRNDFKICNTLITLVKTSGSIRNNFQTISFEKDFYQWFEQFDPKDTDLFSSEENDRFEWYYNYCNGEKLTTPREKALEEIISFQKMMASRGISSDSLQ